MDEIVLIEGLAYISGLLERVQILIEGQRIVEIGKSIPRYVADKVFDFHEKGLIILPGMIDVHVHMRDFRLSYKEDFYTGTVAAAAGGVTIIVDMPNTLPNVNNLEILKLRDWLASTRAIVDYGLYYGVPERADELQGYEEVAIGMKVYPEDLRKECLSKVFEYNSQRKILTIFHAEDPSYKGKEHTPISELRAVTQVLKLTSKMNLKSHITHVTLPQSIDMIRVKIPEVTVDTCPHYVLLSEKYRSSRYYRVNPPLRAESCRRELLKYLIDGKIDILSTDHAPHTLEEKLELERPGFPGLETALPLMLTLVAKDIIGLDRVVELYSMRPARLLGLSNITGKIAKGYYANLAVVDLKREWRVDPQNFLSRAKHSPFENWKIRGKVYATFVRGVMVYENGDITTRWGYGMNIKTYKPSPSLPSSNQ